MTTASPAAIRRERVRHRAIDYHVGQCIRFRRQQLGLSQSELGARIGVTFQQIQKYERGANRVSASMLYRIATALAVPVAFLFEGLPAAADFELLAEARRRADYAASAEGMRVLDTVMRLPPPLRADALRLIDGIADVVGAPP